MSQNKNLIRLKVLLNPATWHFQLKPMKDDPDSQSSSNVIKELSPSELKRFGREILNEPYPVVPGHVYKCAISDCGSWVNGICVQHPLVFVREKRPVDAVYSVTDTYPEFLYLSPSTIPNAGLGVFTRLPLPAGVAFGPYAGFITSSRRAEHGGYAWQKYRLDWSFCWVDAKHELFSNWMRYVNCARWEEEQNVVPSFYYGKTYYHTYKPIAVDTEILTWYGETYAKYLKISTDYGTEYSDRKLAPKKQLQVTITS